MKSLLFVTTIPATLRAFLLPFAYYFRAKGWRVDAMAQGISTCTQCLQAFDSIWEVNWSRNPLNPQNLVFAPQQIRQLLVQEEYDIVHVHTPVAAFVTRYALSSLRTGGKPKIIYTAHGFHFYRGGSLIKNAIFIALEKLAGRWTDYLVVINREDKEATQRYHIVSEQQVRYMPGIGVDVERYSPNTILKAEVLKLRQDLGIGIEAPLFLSVAEFIARKRPGDILKAFAQLGRSDVRLAFAGDGPLLNQMQQLAHDLNLKDQIHFLGYREDVPTLIRASAAMLLASEQEGLPRSIMESLCLEIPAIATNIRGIQDLLADGCGLLVELGDIEGLAQAMNWVLNNPQDAQAMGKRGRERMLAYDLSYILNLHEILYSEALEKLNS